MSATQHVSLQGEPTQLKNGDMIRFGTDSLLEVEV